MEHTPPSPTTEASANPFRAKNVPPEARAQALLWNKEKGLKNLGIEIEKLLARDHSFPEVFALSERLSLVRKSLAKADDIIREELKKDGLDKAKREKLEGLGKDCARFLSLQNEIDFRLQEDADKRYAAEIKGKDRIAQYAIYGGFYPLAATCLTEMFVGPRSSLMYAAFGISAAVSLGWGFRKDIANLWKNAGKQATIRTAPVPEARAKDRNPGAFYMRQQTPSL